MKRNLLVVAGICALAGAAAVYGLPLLSPKSEPLAEEASEEANEARFVRERALYEFNMVRDPVTGKIPKGIRQQEIAFARAMPVRNNQSFLNNGALRTQVANTYIAAGPNNIGGRTRAVLYDRRYNGSSNRVIIAGCVSGGIMRSADGGNNWVRVSPDNDYHTFTALAQDPNNPDTWYAGGGESLGNTADDIGSTYLGFGVYKSTNNGVSWTKLTLSITPLGVNPIGQGTYEAFDHPFDLVHRIAINPVNSHVYIAAHRRLIRSTDGGSSFSVVLEGTQPANTANGQTDVVISNAGQVYCAVNGGNPDANFKGLWVSASGNPNSFSRIAGGANLGVDSVAGWRANDFNSFGRRIILTLAPSNNNIGYVFYENGLSGDAPDLNPEADFFRFDVSGNTYTWTNRSANMPDFPGGNLNGSDPINLQGGYNMEVLVKPDNPDVVFVGGTNLYRSTDGFATTTNTAWIGGYNNTTPFGYGMYPSSHADIHKLTFHPTDPNTAICGNDGGVQETSNIMAPSVTWTMLPNYQTLQCYNVAIDPVPGRLNFASGSQDNGVRFRDRSGLLGLPQPDSNNHRLIFSADGAYVGISGDATGNQYLYHSIQFGRLDRIKLVTGNVERATITPSGLTLAFNGAQNLFGEFVTNLRLEADNSENLYYVNFNRLFRTTSASTVTSASWTEMTGISSAVNPANPTGGANIAIRGLGFTRGPYTSSSVLYVGTTNGKIFRLNDPRNADPASAPADITPPGITANSNVQDIATNPNNDDEVLAVVSNYGAISIWWTKNAKSPTPTWKNAEGNLTLPSARSCVIAVKKDAAGQPVTEYYVGTSAGLFSTTNLASVLDANGAPVWAREGGSVLNFAVITSLAYRPQDNVMLVGTHGNGIYYTSLGTPNFSPGQSTPVNPITNDRNFIRLVAPTVSANLVQFQRGNLPGVQRISVQVLNMNGQTLMRREAAFQNGSVDLSGFATGHYILVITSNDLRYRHVQKLMKQ